MTTSPLAVLAGEAWAPEGACVSTPPTTWFLRSGQTRRAPEVAAAIAVCEGCPVREECAEFARTHRIASGIWGGTLPDDRLGS